MDGRQVEPAPAEGQIAIVPSIECGLWNAELCQRRTDADMRPLDQADDLLAPKTFKYDVDLLFRRMPTTGLATDIPDRPLHRCV